MTTVETQANPEAQEGYENEVVAGFAELADLASNVFEKDATELTMKYQTTGNSEGVFTGVSLADIESMMLDRYPDASIDDIGVKGAQLFNRIILESSGLPQPDDLSRLDSSSYSAKIKTADVLAYAVAHAQDHMTYNDGKLQKEKIAQYTALSGGSESFQKQMGDHIQSRVQDMGFRHNASKYPDMPDYI